MPSDNGVVVPSHPGLHLLLDQPHGDAQMLGVRMVKDALARGTPVVAVLLDEATPQFRADLSRADVDVDAAEEDGRLVYVDAHAPRVGWAHTNPATVFVEGDGADSVLLGLSEAQAGIIDQAPEHLVLVSTFSTLLVLEELNAVYEFCQSLTSMAPRMGAITVGRLIPDMHGDRERTALEHLATTVTDRRTQPTVSAPTQPSADAELR